MDSAIKKPELVYEEGFAQKGAGCVLTIGPGNFQYRTIAQLTRLKNVPTSQWQPASHEIDSYQSRNLVDLIREIPPELFGFARIDYYPFWPFGFELSTMVCRRQHSPP